MNEQTNMHKPDADKKNDRERQEKEIDLHFFGYSSANPDRCFIL